MSAFSRFSGSMRRYRMSSTRGSTTAITTALILEAVAAPSAAPNRIYGARSLRTRTKLLNRSSADSLSFSLLLSTLSDSDPLDFFTLG